MRVLIDTNIFIRREDYSIIPETLQDLMRILQRPDVQILTHKLSIEDIKKDKNRERKEIILSKLKTYPAIDRPPDPKSDKQFLDIIGQSTTPQDIIDDNLLFCVYHDAVDFLITEDKGIHKKAEKLEISERIFNINEAHTYFLRLFPEFKVASPPSLEEVPVHNLDISDPILEPLKKDYGCEAFEGWWKKISREGRKALVYFKDDRRLGAILIHKIENESIDDTSPPLPKKRRLKICTLIVSHTGYKIGELFIKIAIDLAIKNDVEEIYLTHFTKPDDELVILIEDFGFYTSSKKNNGEDIFSKNLTCGEDTKSPLEICTKFYPCFYDGIRVRKFIVPIKPQYHDRLFTDYPRRQTSLGEFWGEFIIEGNTIKKAYLCRASTKKMSPGDLLLFYKSRDEKKLTSIGVVERIYNNVRDTQKAIRYVGKRTVYSEEEVKDMTQKPTKVILFRWHFHLKKPLSLNYLLRNNILKGFPQSIVELSHDRYQKIKEEGGIDGRFTVNQTKIRRGDN